MADRTMEELLQAPTKGYGEAIVILEILAENFGIKTSLLQLVQANKFHGRENDNPHTHISNFKIMTATLKYRDVPNDAIKLMLFPIRRMALQPHSSGVKIQDLVLNQQRYIQDESLFYQCLPQISDVQALPQKNMFNKIDDQFNHVKYNVEGDC
nr:reverse transcriptase domain-containing protein [Tanacetum cinerariifolium]